MTVSETSAQRHTSRARQDQRWLHASTVRCACLASYFNARFSKHAQHKVVRRVCFPLTPKTSVFFEVSGALNFNAFVRTPYFIRTTVRPTVKGSTVRMRSGVVLHQ